MTSYYQSLTALRKLLLTGLALFFLFQCSEEELMLAPEVAPENDLATSTLSTATISPTDCSTCTYVVPSNAYLVDGAALNLQPGAVICLSSLNKYTSLAFKNIIGTTDNPIIITNCGGTATINATGKASALVTENSKYFRISGGTGSTYGIKIIGGQNSMKLEKLSTNFEVDHVEIVSSGFAGIMAKTDPTCEIATNRANFVMRDVYFHHNYIHNTGGEAMYIGHSFYAGVSLSCGVVMPHTIEGLTVSYNRIAYTGWDGIQVGCAISDTKIYNNKIENFGTANASYQKSGIQLNEGTNATLYNNYIKTGTGTGINSIGNADTFIHDNLIIGTGEFGIFTDERTSLGIGIKVINNTIINPKSDGIRLYTDKVSNVVQNNIVVNPGSYSGYVYPRTGNDAYIYLLNKTMNVQISNNLFTRDINYVKFNNPAYNNYRLTSTSPALNTGASISAYNITKDYYAQTRLKGAAYDIGASEY
jgi:hypothetical protein